MIKSEAYKRLTNASRTAYLLLKAQCYRSDQIEVKLPYSQTQEYMRKHTFTRAIRELEDLGFIKISQRGGMFRKTNIYLLIDNWKKQ